MEDTVKVCHQAIGWEGMDCVGIGQGHVIGSCEHSCDHLGLIWWGRMAVLHDIS